MAYINMIQPQDAKGELKEIYDNLKSSRGKIAEIHKIQSLNPPSITAHMDLYMQLMFGKSPLKRYQREMLGVVTSISNNCEYCIEHHSKALNFYWKDECKIEKFCKDYSSTELSKTDIALCDLAKQ